MVTAKVGLQCARLAAGPGIGTPAGGFEGRVDRLDIVAGRQATEVEVYFADSEAMQQETLGGLAAAEVTPLVAFEKPGAGRGQVVDGAT